MFLAGIHFMPCCAGEDQGEGNRYQHFHAKERLPAGGGEPVCPAALHVLLHPAGLQPPAAIPFIQPHHATGLVGHTQLHRPHAGEFQTRSRLLSSGTLKRLFLN